MLHSHYIIAVHLSQLTVNFMNFMGHGQGGHVIPPEKPYQNMNFVGPSSQCHCCCTSTYPV